MAAEKAVKAIDQILDEVHGLKDGITVGMQNFRENMDMRFSSLDKRLLSVNQQIHSCLEEAKTINKYFTCFFDFVFDAAFVVIVFYVITLIFRVSN